MATRKTVKATEAVVLDDQQLGDLMDSVSSLEDASTMISNPLTFWSAVLVISFATGIGIYYVATAACVAVVLVTGSMLAGVAAMIAVVVVAQWLLWKNMPRIFHFAAVITRAVHKGITKAKEIAAQLWASITNVWSSLKSKLFGTNAVAA